ICLLVNNWDESEDDFELSDDDNKLFINEDHTSIGHLFDPDLIDIDSLPIEFGDEVSYNLCSSDKQSTAESYVTKTFRPTFLLNSELCMTDKNPTQKNPKKTVEFQNLKWRKGQKRFEEIRRYLRFNDNSKILDKQHPNVDRLHKIRPLIDHLNDKFNSILYLRDLSLDEQICATKARSYLKKYMPAKPHKWGFEFFVLCDSKGFSYQFEIYSGQENDRRFRLPHEPDLGASSNIVVRLTRNIERNKNHRIYFDNFYTSIPLAAYLKQNGILCLETIRKDGLPNNKIPDERIIKNDPRGKSYEYLTVYENTPISVTSWKDNKQVNLLSTYCGVELFDSLIGRYKIRMRSRKWNMRIFYHLNDTSVVNSWLLYKRARTQIEQPIEYTLVEWRKTLAHTLTNIGNVQTPTRGRLDDRVWKKRQIRKIEQDQPLCLLKM
ncbi:piggyBac transposable element-derived protein 3-like, partial [Aphis craccivora]